MSVASILRRKPSEMLSVPPNESVANVAAMLAEKRVGAVLVFESADNLLGILSERDLVRSLAANGARTLEMTASQLMTKIVHTIRPETSVTEAMEVMTSGRVRHLPVIEAGRLRGVVSIGDIVKERLEQQAHEVDTLRDYVAGQG